MTGFSVVPAASVVLRRGDEVLLQLRSNTGYMDDHWAMSAAGHVEHGESVHEAAVREIREELGLAISGDDLVAGHGARRRASQGCRPGVVPDRVTATEVVPHERVVLDGLRDGDLLPRC